MGYAVPMKVYSAKRVYEACSLRIVNGPEVPDMLTKEQRKIVGSQMKPLLINEDGQILDLSSVPPGELLEVKGRYWSLASADADGGGGVSLIPPDQKRGGGSLITAIEVAKIVGPRGKKLPLAIVVSGISYIPAATSRSEVP